MLQTVSNDALAGVSGGYVDSLSLYPRSVDCLTARKRLEAANRDAEGPPSSSRFVEFFNRRLAGAAQQNAQGEVDRLCKAK